jgi:hypothetical protein
MIFSSTDKDTDWVRVYTAPEVSGLIIEASKRGSYLARDTAIRLRDALDAWLAETGGYARPTPSAPPADHSLIDQLIRRAAAEAVTDQWSDVQIRNMARQEFEKLFAEKASATVLPLHLAPQRTRIVPQCGVCGAEWSDGHGQPGDPCDPEPRDVGHPEPQDHGRLTAELPKRVRSKTLDTRVCECGHLAVAHSATQGCCASDECECDRGPGLVPIVECTCPRYAMHPHGPDGCMHLSCTCKRVQP